MARIVRDQHRHQTALANDPSKDISANQWNEVGATTAHIETGMFGLPTSVGSVSLASNTLTPVDTSTIVKASSGTSDTLNFIDTVQNNDQDIFILRPFSGHTITIANNASSPPANTGVIITLTGANFNLDANVPLILQRNGNTFYQIALNLPIVNTNVAAGAAVAYSKLNLSGSILNADISVSAAIDPTKINGTAGVLNGAQTWTNRNTISPTTTTALLLNHPTGPTGSASGFVGALNVVSGGTIAFATTPQTGTFYGALLNAATLTNPSSGTITNAYTLYISGPPIASTNVTITNPYALYINSGTSKFDGAISATGQITTTGKIVQTLSTATGTGISVALTTTQLNGTDQNDEPLRLQHTISASSASNFLIGRGLQFVFTNSLTGGGAVSEYRAIALEAPISSSGAVTTNYKQIAFFGAAQTGTITNNYGLFFDASFVNTSSINYAIYNNSTAQTYLGGTLQVQGLTTLNGALTVGGGDVTFNMQNTFFKILANQSGAFPPSNNTTLAIGSNFSSGNGEINFWNCQVTPSFSFNFLQKTGASSADKLIEIGTGGLFSTYAKRTTAGLGVATIFGATLQKSETGADTNVLTVTPPAVAGRYRVSVSISVSAATAATLGWTVAWTDSNGHAQTPANMPIFTQNSTTVGLTTSVSANVAYSGDWEFDVDNSAANIVVKTTFTGTSVAYKISAIIEQLA